MRVEAVLPRLAEHLGLRIVRPLAGGEFGATLVTDRQGRELVLKTLPSEAWATTFKRGAALANHMRSRGYPAPHYEATGADLGATWSLQTVLPGDCLDVVREAQMRRLIELTESHAHASPGPGYAADEEFRGVRGYLESALSVDLSRPLAAELASVIAQLGDALLLQDGVVHGDFHHGNFLGAGDEVTGVCDWEFASTGDWRTDLVTLAFWSVLSPQRVPPPIARIAVDYAQAACSREVFALLAASRALTQLGFVARAHPADVDQTVKSIESNIRSWWQLA